jgi:hypothetical protein
MKKESNILQEYREEAVLRSFYLEIYEVPFGA